MYLTNMSLIQDFIINKIEYDTFMQNSYLVWIIRYLLFWILTILVSSLIYIFVEAPFMNLRDKILKSL